MPFHHLFPNQQGALVRPVLFGKHILRIRLFVYDPKQVHRAVTDVTKHTDAGKLVQLFRNSGKSLWENVRSDNADGIFHVPKHKGHILVLKQIILEFRLLLADPSERQSCGDVNIGGGDIFSAQLTGNGGKRENIIVFVMKLVRRKFLVSDADGIVCPVPYQQVTHKDRFGIAFHNAGWKTAVGCFHIAVSVVDPDDFCVVDGFHNTPSFFPSFRDVVFNDLFCSAVKCPHTVLFRRAAPHSENSCSRRRTGK